MSLDTCTHNQKAGIDFVRSIIMMKLKDFVENGHSVWSNACVWHSALPYSQLYYSDKQRAAIDGGKLTIQEAV